jgi:hypothetical protein
MMLKAVIRRMLPEMIECERFLATHQKIGNRCGTDSFSQPSEGANPMPSS